MYKPNFCSDCGTKLLRLRWHFWTSRRFCNDCARRLWQARLIPPFLAGVALIGLGYIAGRARRPAAPPLTIIRRADSPLTSPEDPGGANAKIAATASAASSTNVSSAATPEEDVYICGARTKKGTPCSRRVHGPVRCWQHKGMPAMLPQEKLLVKG